MNEVLRESLMKTVLPDFVCDTIGNRGFDPKLATLGEDLVEVDGRKIPVSALAERSKDEIEANAITSQLLDAIGKANPSRLMKLRKAGFISRCWNSLTGANDSREIEFNLYCNRVNKLSVRANTIVEGLGTSVELLRHLGCLYEADIERITTYIEAGDAYLREKDTTNVGEAEKFGLIRLRRKVINLKVVMASLELHKHSVSLSLESCIESNDRLRDCVKSLLPMWKHQVEMYKAGVYDVSGSSELNKKFASLVNKLNAVTGKE